MSDERRKDYEKIEEISILVKEIHQRQNEVTLPALTEIKNTLYSKGGVCETVHDHTGRLKSLDDLAEKIPTIVGWLLTAITIGGGAVWWIVVHGNFR